jgi:acetyl-CoA C-acetyltransferase
MVSQFHGASPVAEKWGFDREAMEVCSMVSHNRALREGRFDREIAPFEGLTQDATPSVRTLAKMASLEPLPGFPLMTAALASQTCDAAAILVLSAAALKRLGLAPRARVVHLDVMGDDPTMMLTAPIPATKHAGLRAEDIDIAECMEAFASVPWPGWPTSAFRTGRRIQTAAACLWAILSARPARGS